MVLFDIPVARNTHRKRLRRYLHARYFGCLQGSVWITPDALGEERQILAGGQTNVESLILFEGRTCAGESDAQIVASAWDWERIHGRYAAHLGVLEQSPTESLINRAAAQRLMEWAAAEREAWLTAVQLDPLLPEQILPAGYRGQEAWRRRAEVFSTTQKQLREFEAA
jgi:DNA-binding transcriptional regulator PaaX